MQTPQMNAKRGTTIDVNEASKLMVDGIIAYVKAMVRQSNIKYVKASQESNHPKEMEL